MDALVSDAPLIVYVDIKSPYAFVAIKPTLALQAELCIEIDWRPLTLDIPSFLGSARKEAGEVVESSRSPEQWLSVKYGYRDARRYAERQGYVLKGTEKIWDTSVVHIGLQWVAQSNRDQLPAYFDAVYPAFWRRELDVENVDVVVGCIERANVDASGFEQYLLGEGRAQHDQLQQQLHEVGIYGVPTYVFDDQVLFGREHLPYVRWHFQGRVGTAPDVAYEI